MCSSVGFFYVLGYCFGFSAASWLDNKQTSLVSNGYARRGHSSNAMAADEFRRQRWISFVRFLFSTELGGGAEMDEAEFHQNFTLIDCRVAGGRRRRYSCCWFWCRRRRRRRCSAFKLLGCTVVVVGRRRGPAILSATRQRRPRGSAPPPSPSPPPSTPKKSSTENTHAPPCLRLSLYLSLPLSLSLSLSISLSLSLSLSLSSVVYLFLVFRSSCSSTTR